jgi:hypothetical protein
LWFLTRLCCFYGYHYGLFFLFSWMSPHYD